MSFTQLTPFRRTAIAVTVAFVATTGSILMHSAPLHATPASTPAASVEPKDHWLVGLKGKHRQFFDAPAPNGGIALVHVMNYFDTYNKVYGVKDADIDAVLTFSGATTLYAVNDAAWAKYRLGEFLEATDAATANPATSNPWRTAPVVLGMTIPTASISALHKRGATLILCNNALQIFSGLLAAKRGLDAGAVYNDLKASILPEIELVPGMVIATYDVRGELAVDDDVLPGYTSVRYLVHVRSSASEADVMRLLDTADRYSSWRDDIARAVPIERELYITAASHAAASQTAT